MHYITVRTDAAQSGDVSQARPTIREMSPLPQAERINATQRERVKASLIARPCPAKPAHRRWAKLGS